MSQDFNRLSLNPIHPDYIKDCIEEAEELFVEGRYSYCIGKIAEAKVLLSRLETSNNINICIRTIKGFNDLEFPGIGVFVPDAGPPQVAIFRHTYTKENAKTALRIMTEVVSKI